MVRLERLVSGTELSWMIECADGEGIAGLISLWPEADRVEIGFVLARRCWGQGLGTEAVVAVTRWALASPCVAEVWATCDAANRASARVLEKAGYTPCGTFHRDIVRPNLGPEPRPSLLFRCPADGSGARSRPT